MTPREIRQSHGLTIDRAAVYAGVAAATLRLYEISQDAPRPDKRRQLASYYETLAASPPPTAPMPQPRSAP